jgi:hypothetical protein
MVLMVCVGLVLLGVALGALGGRAERRRLAAEVVAWEAECDRLERPVARAARPESGDVLHIGDVLHGPDGVVGTAVAAPAFCAVCGRAEKRHAAEGKGR